jgi:membrane fusion protein, multidrug efflux system
VKRTGAIAAAVVVLAAGLLSWQLIDRQRAGQTASPAPAPIPVSAGIVESKDVPVYVRGLGTVQAFNAVAIKSRVDGQITKVSFTEGQEVKEGDPLFQIDPRPFQAALEQAQANKQKDEAQLKSAQSDLDRATKLLPQGWQTRQSYDQQTATVGGLEAAIRADQAQIDNAQLSLGYALIQAPISGRTGARQVDIGNIVQAAQGTTLVSITQVRPIFVTFTVPHEELDQIRQNQAREALTVVAYAGDDRTRLADGRLTLIDNQVDTTTGTVRLKATFDNTDERLWPGEFVSARLILSVRQKVPTVPAQTVMNGANGTYLYVIKADGAVERRTVEVAATQDGEAVIAKGVSPGEQVVVDGQYRLTDGAKVRIGAPRQASTAR